MYEAFKNQRDELRRQLDRLEDQRQSVVNEMRDQPGTPVNQKGLEQRLANVDQRIADVDKELAQAEADVAKSAAVPGAVQRPVPIQRNGPPDEFYVLTGIFMFVVLLPLTIAYARRIWKRSAVAVMELPKEIYERFARVDQGLDAIAIEVERIGEGQRFLTKAMADQQRAIGPGAAERIEATDRERVKEARRP